MFEGQCLTQDRETACILPALHPWAPQDQGPSLELDPLHVQVPPGPLYHPVGTGLREPAHMCGTMAAALAVNDSFLSLTPEPHVFFQWPETGTAHLAGR